MSLVNVENVLERHLYLCSDYNLHRVTVIDSARSKEIWIYIEFRGTVLKLQHAQCLRNGPEVGPKIIVSCWTSWFIIVHQIFKSLTLSSHKYVKSKKKNVYYYTSYINNKTLSKITMFYKN